MNLRPPAPEAGALPSCATPRRASIVGVGKLRCQGSGRIFNSKGESTIRYLRLWVAVMVARLTGWMSRVSGRGGSSLPGLIARRMAPDVLTQLRLGLKYGTVLITGTNGKTTTAAMARRVLQSAGLTVIANRSGANLAAGIATTFILAGGWRQMCPRADFALLETDEATMPKVGPDLSPRAILVTNVFRDQLDRYGELTTTLRYIQGGIDVMPPSGRLVLNADDPQVAFLGEGQPNVVYYGLEDTGPVAAKAYAAADVSDSHRCPRCGEDLVYRVRYYAHLGDYRCVHCGWNRPQAAIRLRTVRPGGNTVHLLGEFGAVECEMPLPGIYNRYNLVAAAALAWALGVSPETIPEAIREMPPTFGRMEAVVDGETRIWIALVKNPTGFNQVMQTIAEDRGEASHALILINDRHADGRDVSWLWDVDFEGIASLMGVRRWWVSGTRAWDMAVRLKYAGIDEAAVSVMAAVDEALAAAIEGSAGGTLYILPTYTALLEVREALTRRGLVRHFREG